MIALRRGGRHNQRGLELLMLQRGSKARFMPGVWVFAGGIVDPPDHEIACPPDIEAEEWAHRVCAARELGEEGGLEVEPSGLIPWSRWITPIQVPMRFDTRFYVCLAPPHTKPVPDGIEMDEARWMSPQAALDAQRDGSMEISFPTIKHLEELSAFEDADSVMAAAAKRRVMPVLPEVARSGGVVSIALPGEPGHSGS